MAGPGMLDPNARLSLAEKAGYGAADAAANFVFMTMILFQTNYYTEVFGIGAEAAAVILLVGRMWDAVVDPIVGAIADNTNTRWGQFRPWIIATAIPWSVAMILAYTTPRGWGMGAKIAYAAVTNVLLMSIYSMNNMPYAALGGVITGDVKERAKLNTVRFVLVNAAQFVVGGFTLPLVAKFSIGHDRQYGWEATTAIWAAVCLVLFVVTFATTRERVRDTRKRNFDVMGDIRSLMSNSPWIVMVLVTLMHFATLAFRGGALYGYYHDYVDKRAMYACLHSLGLTESGSAASVVAHHAVLGTLGLIVWSGDGTLQHSNVADVFNSAVNMLSLIVTIAVMLFSPVLCGRFGKKAVATCGFALTGLASSMFFLLGPGQVGAMLAMTVLIAVFYAPTIPLLWAMYADVADYCEWTTGRRCTGVVFASICFALKFGLAFGSASYLWTMAGFFGYQGGAAGTPLAAEGYRICSGLIVGVLFSLCAGALTFYKLSKRLTLRMADELPRCREEAGEAVADVSALPSGASV